MRDGPPLPSTAALEGYSTLTRWHPVLVVLTGLIYSPTAIPCYTHQKVPRSTVTTLLVARIRRLLPAFRAQPPMPCGRSRPERSLAMYWSPIVPPRCC